MFSKGKKLFPNASNLGVHIIYTLYVFSLKRCGFLFGFYIFEQPQSFIYIQFSTYICSYIQYFVF